MMSDLDLSHDIEPIRLGTYLLRRCQWIMNTVLQHSADRRVSPQDAFS